MGAAGCLTQRDVQAVLAQLQQLYPQAGPQLHSQTPFEMLVATILSAQCTDARVNQVTRKLFPAFHTPEAFAALTEEELIPYIRTCGLFRAKSRNIIAMSRDLLVRFGGQVPRTLEELTSLAGVGRKTANVVLSNAFGVPAIAVDTHVFRVANRIGLARAKDVEHTERQLMERIPREQWGAAHHLMIFHGRNICHARGPKCGICPLTGVCRHYRAMEKTAGRKKAKG